MKSSFKVRLVTVVVLLLMMTLSILPIPITSSLCLYLVIVRPAWFKKLIDAIYADKVD